MEVPYELYFNPNNPTNQPAVGRARVRYQSLNARVDAPVSSVVAQLDDLSDVGIHYQRHHHRAARRRAARQHPVLAYFVVSVLLSIAITAAFTLAR
jgi:hypothetical protein